MIFKLFEKHLPDSELLSSYAKEIPSVNFLLHNKNKNNIFLNKDMSKYSVESFTFNKLQLMQTFYDKNISF